MIEWSSFSIGTGNSVVVNNGTGATLNRVTGNGVSSIDGKLSATGSLYLINPQGVVVGAGGVVSTGGRFVASTLAADPSAFMDGGDLTLGGTGNGVVINLGKISSSGGDVFLISRSRVENSGEINAPKGTAELVAGSQVLLHDNASGPQVFVQTGSHGSIYNTGAVKAAQISLQAADGNVFALAGNNSELRATGTEARAGHLWLVADGGTVHAHGNIIATNADGSGGAFDMHGAMFHFDNVTIDAAQWNLTTPAYTAGPLAVAVLARILSGGTSVTVTTTGAPGDISVLSNVRWTGAASLTLDAARTVNVGTSATIANTGQGNLTLRADSNGLDNGGSVINRGTLDWTRGTGVVAALYDSNGSYTTGTIKRNAAWVPAPFSGLLSQVTAYQLVNSTADLSKVSNNLAGIYALGKDLDFAGSTLKFNGIGGPANEIFTGQLDGMGHSIHHMGVGAAENNSQTYVGLFSTIGPTGVVRNLGVVDANANGSFLGPVGILAGLNQGLVANVFTSGVVTESFATGISSGGLVAQNDGVMERTSSSAEVLGSDLLGGLAAVNNGSIIQSFWDGRVGGGSRSSAGGLVSVNNGSIAQSYATGVGQTVSIAGIAENNTGTIRESFSAAPVFADSTPELKAGIAGSNLGTIAGDVFWDVQTTTATEGVYSGNLMSAANGLTTKQMGIAASFGPTWDFTPAGAWVMPEGATHPILRWQQGAR